MGLLTAALAGAALPTSGLLDHGITPAAAAEVAGGDESMVGDCASLSDVELPDVSIVRTEVVDGGSVAGEHCLVVGYVTTAGDDVVPSNEVNFHVGLPTSGWNGDFFFQGVGGYAGRIGDLTIGLARGYASVSTDTGHQGSSLDASWALGNVPKQIDWAHRGTHVATVAGKAVTEAYYGEAPEHSFFEGCSNGGRQGLMEAQRYPEDYDGVIAHAPGISIVDMATSWVWQMQAQFAAPGSWLAPEDLAAASASSLETAREAGLAAGDIVMEPRGLIVDLEPLRGQLTDAQLDTLDAFYGESTEGELSIPGMPLGHEEGWMAYLTGVVPPVTTDAGTRSFPAQAGTPAAFTLVNEFLRYFVFQDPDYDVSQFDLGEDLELLEPHGRLINAADPDLTAFANRGGKLLMTHGWADPAINPLHTMAYADAVTETLGPRAEQMMRLYLVPGMFHCSGGPGLTEFDALTAMERWVREGVAPREIPAADVTGEHVAPLCVYPSLLRAGDEAGAAWVCEPADRAPGSNRSPCARPGRDATAPPRGGAHCGRGHDPGPRH